VNGRLLHSIYDLAAVGEKPMPDVSLLIHSGTVLTMDENMRVLSPGYVLTQGERIAQVEAGHPPAHLLDTVDCAIDANGQAVLPGLINAHTHLYQSFLKGLNDRLDLVDWCAEVLFPTADVIRTLQWEENDEHPGYTYALLGAIEMIRGGITCCVDMDIVMDTIFEAWQEIGLRGVGALTLTDQWLPPRLQRDDELLRNETVDFVKRWHATPPESPLTYTALAPSTPFLASRDLLEWTREQALALDVGVQIHVSETRYEVETILAQTGLRPVEYLDSLGFLDERVSAVHCVHVTGEEIEILRRRGATVVHNPKSNLKLGSGVAPVQQMLEAGIPVALGTDGAASNDLLDMFEEMRFAALLPKGFGQDPKAMSAAQVLRMATVHGARASRIDAGVLTPGRLADVITVALDRPHGLPAHDPFCTLVYCARADDVQTVVINGRLVMDRRRILTVSEEEVVAEAVSVGESVYQRSLQSELYQPTRSTGPSWKL
jgi:5-methylthioadenosine/S-adenosylhomocysteine deaminase